MVEENNITLHKVFKELCNSLNLDNQVEQLAWRQYLDTKNNFKLEVKKFSAQKNF